MTIGITIDGVVRELLEKMGAVYEKYNEVTGTTWTYDYMDNFDEFDDGYDFIFSDHALEIFGHANEKVPNAMHWANQLSYDLIAKGHNVVLINREVGNAIPSTLFYLSKTSCKVQNIKFNSKYIDIWNDVDILIAAIPEILTKKPKNKLSIKVNNEFNDDIDSDFTIDSIKDLIDDNNLITNILDLWPEEQQQQSPEERIERIKTAIEGIENKDFKIFFFVIDTKGNPSASVATTYEHVKVLKELGYDAVILHEKNDYSGVESWLGEEYNSLPHASAENTELQISPADFLIIPEVFTNIMEQTKNLPCKRIAFCQSYDYALELPTPGARWLDYGIKDCIITTETQKEYMEGLFPNVDYRIIPVSIPKYFESSDKPKKPIIAIHSRQARDTLKMIKTFYLKFPQYKWITFRDLKGLPREEFANVLKECCLAVWIDDIAGFGTFPIEAMKSDTPVIGKVPYMKPEWMEENNGIWTYDYLQMPDLIASYMKAWLEDIIPDEIMDEMSKMKERYTEEEQAQKIKEVYVDGYFKERLEGLKEFITKNEEEPIDG